MSPSSEEEEEEDGTAGKDAAAATSVGDAVAPEGFETTATSGTRTASLGATCS